MPIPDTDYDPIYEGAPTQWGIPGSIYTGIVLSASRKPVSEKFMGKNNQGNINRKIWHGRHVEYSVEVVAEAALDLDTIPGEGDHVTVDGKVCLCDGSTLNWVQDGETKFSMVVHYFPHMTLTGA